MSETGERPSAGLGLWMWLGAGLGWLAGVAWQLLSPRLAPQGWLLAAVVAAMGGALVMAWLAGPVSRLGRGRARGWGRLGVVLWLPLVAALGAWGSTGWRVQQLLVQRWPAQLLGQDVSVRVRLEGLPQALRDASGRRWRLDAVVADWGTVRAEPGTALPQRLTLYAEWPRPDPPRAGQGWQMRVRLHPPDGLANPGLSAGTLATFGRGVRAVGQLRPGADSLRALADEGALGWRDRIDRWRQATREAIAQRVPQAREAGVLAGLSVGDQAAIAPDDWEVLRRTGTAHLVAISGAHVAMLGGLLAAVAARLWARSPGLCRRLPAPTAARWVAVGGAAVYALLSGGGVPAQRTVWTLAIMGGLRTLGRAWPWPLVCLLSAVAVTLPDPLALVQPGFWLSFVAVAVLMAGGQATAETGMAAQVPPGHARKQPAAEGAASRATAQVRGWRRGWAPLKAEAAALWRTQRLVSLALMPLSLVCFQQVSLVGMVANLLAVPVFGGLITPLALAGVVWPGAWDLAATCTGWMFGVLQWLAAWPVAVWAAPSPPLWVAVAAVLASLVLVAPGPWRWRSLALPFLWPLLSLPEPWRVLPQPALGQFAAIALDVGQGTAVLVRTAHHQLLFDTGARLPSGGDMGSRVVLPVLQALGVRRLDALVVSHQDNDHVGGAWSVMQGVPVAELRTALPPGHPLLGWRSPSGQAPPHRPCVAGQSWRWDGVRFEVLHPTQEGLDRWRVLPPNAVSCVLRVQADGAPGRSLLLAGDIGAAQERDLLARRASEEALRSTVLVVPHHGSLTSSTPGFLAAVQPEVAVIQAGRRNRYGHPAAEVLARYRTLGAQVASTPACGAFLWRSDEEDRGGRLAAGQCWRALHPRLWEQAPS